MNIVTGITKTITLGDQERLQLQDLSNVRSDSNGLIIQIFAHGGPTGIAETPGAPVIPWTALIQSVSECRTTLPIRLDILGVCNSKYIVPHLTSNATIDLIWLTTEFTTWQSVNNRSRHFFDFNKFLDDLSMDGEARPFIPTYREIKWNNHFRLIPRD